MSRKFYAVQIGLEDTDCGFGSTRKREAMSIARRAARQEPGRNVRICICTLDSDFCLDEIEIQEGI